MLDHGKLPRTNPSGRPTRIPFDLSAVRGTIFQALLHAPRGRFGGATTALVDGDGRALSYDEIVRASFALGHALKQAPSRAKVGVMLPTGAAAAMAFLALSAYGRVPAMLNFTTGAAGLKSAHPHRADQARGDRPPPGRARQA